MGRVATSLGRIRNRCRRSRFRYRIGRDGQRFLAAVLDGRTPLSRRVLGVHRAVASVAKGGSRIGPCRGLRAHMTPATSSRFGTVPVRNPAIAARWFTELPRRTVSAEHDRQFTRWCSQYTVGALLEHFDGRPPTSILDIGCGDGGFLALARSRFPDATLTGIDPSADAIEEAQQNTPSSRLVSATAETLNTSPLADCQFDAIVVQLNLALWDDPHLGLKNAAQMLRPGGLCYIVDPVAGDTDRISTAATADSSGSELSVANYLADQAAASFTFGEATALVHDVTQSVEGTSVRVGSGGIMGYPIGSQEAVRIWRGNADVRAALLEADRSSDADLLYVHIIRNLDAGVTVDRSGPQQ
ncbi:hypothetical protein CH295_25455 [Rhodococcus sp. 14-2483-1-2]|nr:hypothetical protein CH295_25455 [Rhodococcus sp. 14-2483-1-2]